MDRAETVAREILFRWASDGRMTMTADDIARLVPLYAAAIRAERERCARIAERSTPPAASEIAAKIRADE